jgi:hypothetical protein
VHSKFILIYSNAQLEGSPCPSSAIHRPVPLFRAVRGAKKGRTGSGTPSGTKILLSSLKGKINRIIK